MWSTIWPLAAEAFIKVTRLRAWGLRLKYLTRNISIHLFLVSLQHFDRAARLQTWQTYLQIIWTDTCNKVFKFFLFLFCFFKPRVVHVAEKKGEREIMHSGETSSRNLLHLLKRLVCQLFSPLSSSLHIEKPNNSHYTRHPSASTELPITLCVCICSKQLFRES